MAGFILPVISGLAGLFGGGKQSTQNTSNTTNSNSSNNSNTSLASTGTTSSSTSPVLTSLQSQLANTYSDGLINQYKQGTDLTGYEQSGLENINNNNSDTVLQNILAQKGQTYSPAATTAETQNQLNRVGQDNQFASQIPLLQTQLKQQALSGLVSGFSALPTGTTTSGTTSGNTTGSSSSNTAATSNSTGQTTTRGNPIAGAVGGVGAGLAAPGTDGESTLQNILGQLGF